MLRTALLQLHSSLVALYNCYAFYPFPNEPEPIHSSWGCFEGKMAIQWFSVQQVILS